MAETKKRAASKRPSSSKAKPKSTRSRATKSRATKSSNGSSNGGAADTVLHAVEGKAKTASHAVGSVASKAKVPLIAGGAALAGAVGGAALAARHEHRHAGLTKALRKPRIKLSSGDVAKAAKEVGNFSAQMGELATELQRARESNNNAKHRSPVEVVLQGLTARR